MATTSESEDFESADEDFAEETAAVVPSLKDNCQKELNKLHTTSTASSTYVKTPLPEPQPSKPVVKVPVTEEVLEYDDSPAAPSKLAGKEPPADRRKRQQKPREAKPTAPKKLGTRITTAPTDESTAVEHLDAKNTSQSVDPDPFAQFRGYSSPPIMERCWETDDDGKPILGNQPAAKLTESKDKEEEPLDTVDPYAKFRGYAQPPLMQRCWETDCDGKPILDTHETQVTKRIDVDEPPKVEETPGGDQNEEDDGEVDPFAMFRGYAVEPEAETAWEDDVDVVEIDEPLKEEETPEGSQNEESDGEMDPSVDQPAAKLTKSEVKEKEPLNAVDPYAKFRGYAQPPLMQRCWETDRDGKPILDTHETKVTERINVVEPPKVEEAPGEDQNEGDDREVDPFAMFRGYAVEPAEETAWEDDVDDVEIDEDLEVTDQPEKSEPEVVPRLPEAAAAKSSTPTVGFGWGGWGVSSLLATATESVASLTSQVSSALEAGIGAPDPVELARRDRLEEHLLAEFAAGEPTPQEEQAEASGMFGFVSSFTRLVETTGNKVLTGGLDTLESIGKKTMEVLQEGDPGLKKKRALFSDKTVLSQILREAKERAEVEDKETEDKQAERAVHFETLFDDFQGLVHLEALEMLSKQCDLKLQALTLASTGPTLAALQRRLREIRDACQLPEEDEEEEEEAGRWLETLATAEKQLGVPIAAGKLEQIVTESSDWLQSFDAGAAESRTTAHAHAVSTLARLTAASAEQFHKTAEMLLVKEQRDAIREAHALITITTVLCGQVSAAATRFCEALSNAKTVPSEAVNASITSIFLEASNSSSYIQEAFQLLVPVLQVGSAL